MRFANKNIGKVYKYIFLHDGETILYNDIADGTGLTRQTVARHVRWLLRRELIKKTGRKFSILPV